MLQNESTLAIGGVDPAEKDPLKVRQVTNRICRNVGRAEAEDVEMDTDVDMAPEPPPVEEEKRGRKRRFGDSADPPEDASAQWTSVAPTRVERFVGEGQNHSNYSDHSNSFKIGIFPRKFKNVRKFQHFLNSRRNSDKISSKSE